MTKNNAQPSAEPPVVKAVGGMTAVPTEIEDASVPVKAAKVPKEAPPAEVDDEVLDAAVKAAEEAAAEETGEEAETAEQPDAEEQPETPEETAETAEQKPEEKPEEALVEDFDEALELPAEKPAEQKTEKTADVVKLETELAQAKQGANEWAFTANLLNKDPELEHAYLKSLKKNGVTLRPEHAARLAELDAQMRPQAPGTLTLNWNGKPVVVTEEKVAEQHAKWTKEGKTLEASMLLDEYKRAKDEIAQGPVRAAALAKQKAEAEAKAAADAEAKIHASVQAQLKVLAGKLGPKYLVVEKNGFVRIADQQFAAALKANANGVSPDAPLAKLVRYTLFTMGRLKAPGAKAAPKVAGKPPIQSSRSKTQRTPPAPKGKLPQGQTFVPVELANE